MSRTRIKFCGITRMEDAVLAAELGVDAIGLVLTARSRRRIGLDQAAQLRRALPPLVTAAVLLMDEDAGFVREALAAVQPDLLQFHGSEADAWCTQFGRRYLKAIGMADGAAALARLRAYPGACGLLLDGHGLGEAGGTGQRFDWSLMPTDLAQPLILAGGLHAGNVGEAIRVARPWGVDVSSGVEAAPGIKDPAKMRAFVEAVRESDDAARR